MLVFKEFIFNIKNSKKYLKVTLRSTKSSLCYFSSFLVFSKTKRHIYLKSLQETCHLATAETVGKGLKSRWYRS